MGAEASYTINGRVVDRSSGAGFSGVLVKAWDADLFFDDLLGSASTDDSGNFRMQFDESYFAELFLDRVPDLYFEIYYKGKCVYSTEGLESFGLQPGEQSIEIEVDLEIFKEEEPEEPAYPDPRQYPEPPPDDPVDRGEHYDPPEDGPWQEIITDWWNERKRQREEDGTLHVPQVPIPKPYLNCTSNFGPQLNALAVNEMSEMRFTVWNDGNFPAWTCYVELYEGPGGYSHPLSDYELRGRKIITLRPGERREVAVPWVRRRETARVVGILFDPLLDPKDFTLVEQRNRHITSIHYGRF